MGAIHSFLDRRGYWYKEDGDDHVLTHNLPEIKDFATNKGYTWAIEGSNNERLRIKLKAGEHHGRTIYSSQG